MKNYDLILIKCLDIRDMSTRKWLLAKVGNKRIYQNINVDIISYIKIVKK